MYKAENTSFSKPKIILLDVYETLLDMSEVVRKVNSLMDSKRGYTIWFEMFMQYCFVDNCTIQFNDFAAIAKATMQMTANMLDRKIAEHEIDNILEILKHLPVHDGVQSGLSALIDDGYRLAALTNSPEAVVRERMERTGLISYFECVLSAEHVKKYKPGMEVYKWAAKKMDTKEKEMLLVSAHGWDIAGAANAGLETAFMKLDNEMLYPLAPKPCIVCSSLLDLANQLREMQQVHQNL